jgi:D-glycero-D-manno-heptose 1,7-bisphosphate phosphatase
MKPFAFIDRDGTVIVEKEYLGDPDGVELLPGTVAGLRRLRELGYGLVIVTNQAGVGRGFYTEVDVRAVNQRMADLLADHDLAFDGVYYCPHRSDAGCVCRKPAPGMIRQAQAELAVDMARSVVIGDRKSDIGLGKGLGLRAILVQTGYGAAETGDTGADAVVADLLAAAEWLAGEDAT